MSKKQVVSQIKKEIPPVTKSVDEKPSLLSISFHKNLLIMGVCLITIFVLQKQIGGYRWLWNTLIKENIEMIKKAPNKSEL